MSATEMDGVTRYPICKWFETQQAYEQWTQQPLDNHYLQRVRHVGNKMRVLIGKPGYCLDVGCGNGLFGGRPVAETGYRYIEKDPTDHIIGIDPLKPLADIPWLDQFFQRRIEEYCSDAFFKTIIFASSLDHVTDWRYALRRANTMLDPISSQLCMYFTETPVTIPAHPVHLTQREIVSFLNCLGLNCTTFTETFSKSTPSWIVYIKARRDKSSTKD